jgi:hypothetical protein
MGSTCVARVSSGVAPELSAHHQPAICRAETLVERSFRRDAENHTPEAYAPRDSQLRPFSIPKFGVNRGVADAAKKNYRARNSLKNKSKILLAHSWKNWRLHL